MSVRFDDVTIDFEARALTRGGRALTLSPKAFDLLRLLIERRPAVIAFSALRGELWPQSHVGQSSLPALVAEIRGVLDETAQGGGTIRTVHRVGYAFAATATELDATASPEPMAWMVLPDRRVPLTAGEHTLGRDGPGVIAINDTTVSRRHAKLVVHAQSAVLEDLGSKNGTWLGGSRVDRAVQLNSGAQFMLGTVKVEFTRDRPDTLTETVPPEVDQRQRRARNRSPRTRLTT